MSNEQYKMIIDRVYEKIMAEYKSAMSREELEELFAKKGKSFLKQIEEDLLETKDKDINEIINNITDDYNKSLSGIAMLSPGISTGLHDSKYGITINTYSGKMSDIPNDDQITEDTVFDTSSMTKLFTALLLLKEQEKGNIDLNKTFADYSPLLKNIDVTIIDALRFSTIIRTDGRVDEKGLSKEERIKRLLSAHVVERDTYEYNDFPYMFVPFLFGNTIEEASTNYLKKFNEFFRDELGLEHTGYSRENMAGGTIKTVFDKENNSFIYQKIGLYDPKARLFETEVGLLPAHAGVTTTTKDLEKLSDLLFNGKVISNESIKELTTTVRPGMVELLDKDGNKVIRNGKAVTINHGLGVYINTGSISNSTLHPSFSPTAFNAYGSTGASASFDLENGFSTVKLPNYRNSLYNKWVRINDEKIGDTRLGDEFPAYTETTLIGGTHSLKDGSLIRPDNTEMRPGRASNNYNIEEIKALLKLRIAKTVLMLKAHQEYSGEELEEALKQIDEAFNKASTNREKVKA